MTKHIIWINTYSVAFKWLRAVSVLGMWCVSFAYCVLHWQIHTYPCTCLLMQITYDGCVRQKKTERETERMNERGKNSSPRKCVALAIEAHGTGVWFFSSLFIFTVYTKTHTFNSSWIHDYGSSEYFIYAASDLGFVVVVVFVGLLLFCSVIYASKERTYKKTNSLTLQTWSR